MKSCQDNIAYLYENDARVLFLGDFNFSSIEWCFQPDGSLIPSNYLRDDLDDANAAFVHLLSCFNIQQFNRFPNCNGRFLDLVLTDLEPSKATCIEPSIILCDIIDAHHPPLQLILDITKPSYLSVLRRDYRNAGYDAIITELNEVDWKQELTGDADEMTQQSHQTEELIWPISLMVQLQTHLYVREETPSQC